MDGCMDLRGCSLSRSLHPAAADDDGVRTDERYTRLLRMVPLEGGFDGVNS